MKRLDADFVLALVARTHDIKLQADSARRSADAGNAIAVALAAVAGGSLFDTEPAHFERELHRLRGGPGDD